MVFFEQADDISGIANCTNHIGIVYHSIGKDEKAKEFYLKAQLIYDELDDYKGQVYLFNNLGYIEEVAGELELALNYYNKGLGLARSIRFLEMEVHL